jgi:MFS family permease
MVIVRGALGALSYRNYRLFFFGQSISLLGTWLQNVGLSWLIYRLTHSPVMLGTIQFAMLIPALIIGPVAGVWVDRLDRKRLLITTQVLSGVQAAILSALVLTQNTETWMLMSVAVGLGIVSAFDVPGRQTLVAEIIEDRRMLPNAIALNSALFNSARLVGPAVAGVIIHQVGEGICFGLNAVSYLPVIVGIAMMRLPKAGGEIVRMRLWEELREGWAFVSGSVPIRSIILFLALGSFMGGCYSVLLPIYASNVFKGGADTLGTLYSAVGLGALVSGVWLASRQRIKGLSLIIAIVTSVFGAGLIALAVTPWLWLSLVILALIGFGAMSQMTSSNTLVQSLVDDRMRGRVMAFYTMAFFGASPFGSLASGAAADAFGVRATTAGAGVLCLIGCALFFRIVPKVRESSRLIIHAKAELMPQAMPGGLGNREAANPALEQDILDTTSEKT